MWPSGMPCDLGAAISTCSCRRACGGPGHAQLAHQSEAACCVWLAHAMQVTNLPLTTQRRCNRSLRVCRSDIVSRFSPQSLAKLHEQLRGIDWRSDELVRPAHHPDHRRWSLLCQTTTLTACDSLYSMPHSAGQSLPPAPIPSDGAPWL